MPDLDFVTVVGRFGITAADSADAGDDPEIIWCDAGDITLEPLIAEAKVAGGSPVPWTGGQASYVPTIDAAGFLSWRGRHLIKVIDLTSTTVNPRIISGKATHKVTFRNVKSGNLAVTFTGRDVRLAADTAEPLSPAAAAAYDLPEGTLVCDLTKLLPVPVANSVPIVVGQTGTGLTGGIVQESPTGVAFELTNGAVTEVIELPVGPGGSDVGVAGYLDDEDSDTRAVLDPLVTAKVQEGVVGNIDTTTRKLADNYADVSILDLDDSTGAQSGQYPDRLLPQLQALYPHRTAFERVWDNVNHVWGVETQVGPTGTGGFKIVLWKGAVSGTTYEQPLNYWDTWIASVQPDLAIIGYGHNYGKTAAEGGQPDDATMDRAFRERCLRFVAEFKRACPRADVLLIAQNPYIAAGARSGISDIRAQIKREIAADLGCAYGPVLEAYLATGDPAAYLNGDGLHPNTQGAQLAAATLLPMFRVQPRHEISPRLPSPLSTVGDGSLTNGDLIEFASGALTGFTLTRVALSKDTINYESPNGYAIKMTVNDAGPAQAYQALPIRRVRGRVITFAARVYVASAQASALVGRAQISGDGFTSVTSATITSVRDNFVWVFATVKIPAAATYATASLLVGSAVGDELTVDRLGWVFGHMPRESARRGALTTFLTQVTNTEDSLAVGQMVPRRDLMQSTVVSHTSGTVGLSYFTAERDQLMNNVTVWSGATAAGATPTLCRIGVFQIDGAGNGTLLAATANDTTLFAAANTQYTRALTTPFTMVKGQRYVTATLVVSAATMPSFMGPTAVASAPSQAAFGLAPRMIGRLTTMTDLPASFTEAVVSPYSLRNHCLLT